MAMDLIAAFGRSMKSIDLDAERKKDLFCASDPMEDSVCFAYMRTLTFPGQTKEGVILRLNEELKERGFDIVSRVDLQAALETTGKVFDKPYVVFGVVHPEMALQALAAEPALGPLLPFSIALTENAAHEMVLQVVRPAVLWSAAVPADQFPVTAAIVRDLDQLLRDTFDTVVRLPLPHPDVVYTWPPVRLPPEAGAFEVASKRAWDQVKDGGKAKFGKAGKNLPGENIQIMAGSMSRPMSLDSNAPGTPTNEAE
eukprot:jgi/Botrbrau1/14132/Bobra.182_3s0073.1